MPSELSPQNIRDVRFREKLRGYHPEDVDEFVASVATTVEGLHRRINELSAAVAEATEARAPQRDGEDVEESLRRTLILAQRTADLAVQEAREEATRIVGESEVQRDELLREIDELRTRTMAELENELAGYRQRLHDERDALQRDVNALQLYVSQERERLRIYFSQQLTRIDEGVPGVEPAPAVEAPDAPAPPAFVEGDATPAPEQSVVVDEPGLPVAPVDEVGSPEGGTGEHDVASADDDDPFLAELRRAVTDNEPLGPRDDTDVNPDSGGDDKLDIFNDDQGTGRFLRRKR